MVLFVHEVVYLPGSFSLYCALPLCVTHTLWLQQVNTYCKLIACLVPLCLYISIVAYLWQGAELHLWRDLLYTLEGQTTQSRLNTSSLMGSVLHHIASPHSRTAKDGWNMVTRLMLYLQANCKHLTTRLSSSVPVQVYFSLGRGESLGIRLSDRAVWLLHKPNTWRPIALLTLLSHTGMIFSHHCLEPVVSRIVIVDTLAETGTDYIQ